MNTSKQSINLKKFKIEELEPRLEMGKWSAFARSEQDSNGNTYVKAGFRLTY